MWAGWGGKPEAGWGIGDGMRRIEGEKRGMEEENRRMEDGKR